MWKILKFRHGDALVVSMVTKSRLILFRLKERTMLSKMTQSLRNEPVYQFFAYYEENVRFISL